MTNYHIHGFHHSNGRWAIFVTNLPLPSSKKSLVRDKIGLHISSVLGLVRLEGRKIYTSEPGTGVYKECLRLYQVKIEMGFDRDHHSVVIDDKEYKYNFVQVPT